MSDDSRTYVFPQKIATDVLQLSPSAPLGSITIVNQTQTMTISVFKSGLASPNAQPDFKVYPGQFQTTPLPGASTVGLRFDGAGESASGSVYVHFSTDFASASSGSIATSAPTNSQPYSFVSEGDNLSGVGTFVDSHGKTVAYFNLPNTQGSEQLLSPVGTSSMTVFIETVVLSGLPAYVVFGIRVISAGGGNPTGWSPIMTGPGVYAPKEALQVGSYSNPSLWACFYNYDSIAQLEETALNLAIAGYCQ